MKILITGHKGFIGQNMVNALKDEHELYFLEWGDPLPKLEGLDWCIHLGANSSTTETDVDLVLRQNYDFSRYLINECQVHGVNFQFASSASVYGLGTDFREEAPLSPLSPYAWSKMLTERYILGFRERWTIKFQMFRYFNVYGPYEDHKGNQASPYYNFKKQAMENGIIKLFAGSENYFRDFVPVEHVVDIHKKFFNVEESGVWNLGTGKVKSFQKVATTIAEKHNAKIKYIPIPENIQKQYQKYTRADITKLTETLQNNENRS